MSMCHSPGEHSDNVHLFSPIYPERAVATFPPYGQLDTGLRKTLENSTLEADPNAASLSALPGATPGERLYAGLSDLQKAGLLNVYRKLAATPVGDGMGWQFVNDLYRFRKRPSRLSRPGEDSGQGRTLSQGRWRSPQPTHWLYVERFIQDDRKLRQPAADLLASTKTPLEFRVDSDIDDASGIGHVFQVLRNWLTGSQTHPYDIHQILAFHQALKPQYDLSV